MTLTTKPTQPSKEQVRAVMEQHRKDGSLPSRDEYRRQMGWNLEPNNKSAECAR